MSDDYPQGKEQLGERCIDGGKCHHRCAARCFRREMFSPFSGYTGPWAYEGDPVPQRPTLDAIAKASHIMGLIDDYVAAPTSPARQAIRTALLARFADDPPVTGGFPGLPGAVYRHPVLGDLFDAMQVHQYTARHWKAIAALMREAARQSAFFGPPGVVMFNPYTGEPRDLRDVESDPGGQLIMDPRMPMHAAAPAAAGPDLTEAEVVAVWQGMPGGPDGWLKSFGFLQFARAILAAATKKARGV